MKTSEYREQAAQCRRLAAQMDLPEHREQLLQMAATWEAMAEEREALLRSEAKPAI